MKSNLWDTVCKGVLCKSYVRSKSKLVTSKQSKGKGGYGWLGSAMQTVCELKSEIVGPQRTTQVGGGYSLNGSAGQTVCQVKPKNGDSNLGDTVCLGVPIKLYVTTI